MIKNYYVHIEMDMLSRFNKVQAYSFVRNIKKFILSSMRLRGKFEGMFQVWSFDKIFVVN